MNNTSNQDTLLIVDDIAANVKVLADFLKSIGFKVLIAKNGKRAIQKAEYAHPDLILMDIMMPEMDGFEACRILKSQENTQEIPIIFMTALTDTVDKVKGFKLGAADYITKPIQQEEVLARVKSHLKICKLQHQLQVQNQQLQQQANELAKRNDIIAKEKEKSEKLLLKVLPALETTNKELRNNEQELIKLNQASQRFVPHQFLNSLGRESVIDVQLGDQVAKEMTILFADIRNFTSLSEKMSPEDNFNFINAFLAQMEPAIAQHNGFIDKYIGDAIMALFPSADDALRAAIGMLKRLATYNLTQGRPGRPVINIGIGLNTGQLILGTVGTHNRMDSTVIADAVNLASRVEQLTKTYNIPLLITEHTYRKLAAPFRQYHIRVIDTTKVKGKTEEITIYEVFDADQPESIALKNKTLSTFKQGFVLYHCGELPDAQVFLKNVLQVNKNDNVARTYLKNCQKILNIVGKPKILLIDDTADVIRVLLSILDGFDVSVAEDGKIGLEIAESNRPHLILLDIIMPIMDGYETCKCLKANSKTKDIPVIFMTALSETTDKVKGLALGAADYITKPFKEEEVLLRVKTHLNLYRLKQRLELEIHNSQLKEKFKALTLL